VEICYGDFQQTACQLIDFQMTSTTRDEGLRPIPQRNYWNDANQVSTAKNTTIRLLTQRDYDVVQSYLNQDPLHSILMIHSLQTHGLESDLGTFWGAFDDGRLVGVLFADNGSSRRRFGCLAADNPAALAQLGQLALEAKVRLLLGRSTYIQPAIDNLPSRIQIGIRYFSFYQVRPEQLVCFYDHPVRAATEEDIPLLVELYRDWEFQRRNRDEEEIEREIRRVMDESGRYFLIEMEGQAVSAARVFPETDQAGMIGAARTLPAFRGRGMYPCVRTTCFEYLFKQGKTGLGLFEETNASITRVVSKQGGTIVARWLRVNIKERPPLRRRILPSRLRRWGLNIRDRVLRR
jgi:predicted GNAT family acetyltransferase